MRLNFTGWGEVLGWGLNFENKYLHKDLFPETWLTQLNYILFHNQHFTFGVMKMFMFYQ